MYTLLNVYSKINNIYLKLVSIYIEISVIYNLKLSYNGVLTALLKNQNICDKYTKLPNMK